jgi:acetyl esterase/lipase
LISAVFFVWFFTAGLWTVNALRRPVPPGRGLPPMWLPGMIVSELAPLFFILRALIAWIFLSFGAGSGLVGLAGVTLFALGEVGLVVVMTRTIRSAADTGHSPTVFSLLRVWDRLPAGSEVLRGLHYSDGLTLDLYRHASRHHAPTLVYLHPGSWMRGRPGRQARALIHGLLAQGWVVADIRYPLSPDATFPEHLLGVRRAILWVKTEGAALGVDPGRVVLAGASSGAHLAALAALTWDHPDLEAIGDVTVAGCLPFYGIYDLLVRNATRYDWPFVARHVMKAAPSTHPELYRLGSPLDQVRSDAPPFLVIHGDFDSVVLADESRQFVEALRSVGADAGYYEVLWAQHGFDAISSLRSRAVAGMCIAWLEGLVAEMQGQGTRGA